MPDDLRQRARQIFMDVADLPSAEVPAALDRLCAHNAALRAEVESLLRAQQSAAGFLVSPTLDHPTSPAEAPTLGAPAGADAAPIHEGPGSRIGPYKLLQLIGEGGFGSVFMAEQEQPVRRRVALKIIKLGMDTRQVVARFEQERQALAILDHPSIAKVFDAGATDTGRPYFVMELCTGEPIDAYCDRHSLSISQRLELFAQVCHAVQHAHTKGIIHRDIKPRNILVATQDGRPHAKVIDFGIAKATEARLTERTLFTEHKQIVGTPEYMSPEQAEGSLDIDTRTDVYALGVLLYELLTGSTPFTSDELRSAAYAEIQRIIREVEPPAPSTRLNQNAQTLASIAARRNIEPRRLNLIIRGELDWIVMKALDKDRKRRYETADGLAQDIRRYIAGEPISAAPPSRAYRLRTFIRRHRGPVIAAALIATALILGLIGTTTGMLWARHERERATLAAAAESAAKALAQDNEHKALAAAARAQSIADFVTTSLGAADAYNPGGGQSTTILAAMDRALADLNAGRFKNDPETEASLQHTIARILQHNGREKQARPLFQQALDTRTRILPADHADIAASLTGLAGAELSIGDPKVAESLYAKSLDMLRRLHPGDHESVAAALGDVANARINQFRNADAEPLLVEALAMLERLNPGDDAKKARTLDTLATVRYNLGRGPDAEALYQRALDMNQRLFPGDNPRVLISLFNLGTLRKDLGRPRDAEPLLTTAYDMARRLYTGDHQYLATAINNLANLRTTLGHPEQAEPLYVQALDMNRRLYPADNLVVANGLYNLGYARHRLGRAAEAESLLLEALAMYARLTTEDRPQTATTLYTLAMARESLGKHTEARASFDQAIAMGRRLWPTGSRMLIAYLRASAEAHIKSNDRNAAATELEEALTIAQRHYASDAALAKNIQASLDKARSDK
jgi:serine/threonine protein kinase